MRFGVCYYPEQWPAQRWARDAGWLKDLGVGVVRMAEFAWGALEPAPGRMDFAWLDRAVDLFAGAGFEVVLGTPTAAPPAWLSDADLTTLPVDDQGRRRRRGGRRHYCPSSPAYRAHTERIVSAMAERYGAHDGVVGWQIDNELGGGHTGRCYCESCEARFRAWLRARYATVGALNEAWGTAFWSAQLRDFDQVRVPILHLARPNPGLVLDYERFSTHVLLEYERLQVDLLRARLPAGRWVTHNFMGLYPDLDAFALAAPLDLASWDSYPTGNLDRWRATLYGDDEPDPAYAFDVGDPAVTGFAHDLTYGLLDRPFWVMEQQVGHIDWGRDNTVVRERTVRLWCWHAVASGADAIVYFRERAALAGQEQYHSGLLAHDGSPAIGYRAARRLAAERAELAALTAATPSAAVALLLRYDDLWSLRLSPHAERFTYLRALFCWYRALQRLGIPVAVTPGDRDLRRFALVLAPAAHVVDDALAERIAAYVEGGGAVVLGPRAGVKDSANRVVDGPLPGPLRALAGATVAEWGALPAGMGCTIASALAGLGGQARTWIERLVADDAEVIARYGDGPFAEAAALTSRRVGAGEVSYCGWLPTSEQAMAMLADLARRRGIERLAELPAGLVACRRGDRVVLLNFTDAALRADIEGRSVEVAAGDVVVV